MQNVYLKKENNQGLTKNIKVYSKDDFFAAKQKLKNIIKITYLLCFEITYNVENNAFRCSKTSEKVIDECPVSFPICYYILAEISFNTKTM